MDASTTIKYAAPISSSANVTLSVTPSLLLPGTATDGALPLRYGVVFAEWSTKDGAVSSVVSTAMVRTDVMLFRSSS